MNYGENFFRGSGRSILSPSRSNPFLYQTVNVATPFPHKKQFLGTTINSTSFFDLQRPHSGSVFLTNKIQKTSNFNETQPSVVLDSQQSTLSADSAPFLGFKHSNKEFSAERFSLLKQKRNQNSDVNCSAAGNSENNSIYMNLPKIQPLKASSSSSNACHNHPPKTSPLIPQKNIYSGKFITPLETAM